jgi:hypothetical protein
MKRNARRPLRIAVETVRLLDRSELIKAAAGANRASVLNNAWGNCSAGSPGGSCIGQCNVK